MTYHPTRFNDAHHLTQKRYYWNPASYLYKKSLDALVLKKEGQIKRIGTITLVLCCGLLTKKNQQHK